MAAPRLGTLALVVAIGLAGCGGSGSHDATQAASGGKAQGAAPLTKAQYLSAGNRLCRVAGKRVPAFPGTKSGGGYKTTASLVVPYLQKVLSVNSQTYSKLSALQPPTAQAAGHARLLEAQQQRINDLRAALTAAQNRDGKNFTRAFQRDVKQDEPSYIQAAKSLGLAACARGH